MFTIHTMLSVSQSYFYRRGDRGLERGKGTLGPKPIGAPVCPVPTQARPSFVAIRQEAEGLMAGSAVIVIVHVCTQEAHFCRMLSRGV